MRWRVVRSRRPCRDGANHVRDASPNVTRSIARTNESAWSRGHEAVYLSPSSSRTRTFSAAVRPSGRDAELGIDRPGFSVGHMRVQAGTVAGPRVACVPQQGGA